MDIMVKTLNQVKKAFGETNSKMIEPYASAAGVVLILKGAVLFEENDATLAPKIKEINPAYYNQYIQRIYLYQGGGGGSSDNWGTQN